MNCALIGLGMVADTHLAAIADIPDLHLTGVMGRTADRAQAFANKATEKLGYLVGVYTNVASVAADDTVDFVILCTPPDARLPFAESLCAAGKPILMEKPIERSLAAAQQIVDLYDNAGLVLGICFQHRVRAGSVALKQAIEQDELGSLQTVSIRVPWWRDQSYYDAPGRGTFARDGGGVLITQAIHSLDLALWIAGPVVSLQAMKTTTELHKLDAEDWASSLLEFQSGCVGFLEATTAAYPGFPESLSIQGTKAHAHLQGDHLHINALDGQSHTQGAEVGTGGGADPMAFGHAWHQSIIENFMQSLTDGSELVASGSSALKTHAVLDAIDRAAHSQKREKVLDV